MPLGGRLCQPDEINASQASGASLELGWPRQFSRHPALGAWRKYRSHGIVREREQQQHLPVDNNPITAQYSATLRNLCDSEVLEVE